MERSIESTAGPSRRTLYLVTAFVFALSTGATLVAWHQIEASGRALAGQAMTATAEQSARRLEDYMRSRLLALQSAARVLASAGAAPDRAAFTAEAAALLGAFSGFQAINWLDPSGTIRWLVPHGPNREAEGRDVSRHPQAGPVLRATEGGSEPQLSAPLELFQGGVGVTTYVPVEVDGQLVGYLNGVFRVSQMTRDSLRGGALTHHALRVRDAGDASGVEVWLDDDFEALSAERPVGRAALSMRGRRWVLEQAPRDALWEALQPEHGALLGAGLGLSLLLSALAFGLIQRQRQRAREAAVHQRLLLRTEEAARFEAVGRLAGGVAHDFNNLLVGIMGHAELALLASAQRDAREPVDDHVRQVLEAAQRAAVLTRQLLSFGRPQPAVVQLLDLNAQLRALQGLLRALVPERVQMTLSCHPAPCVISADEGWVGRVVVNLVTNAVDAMPDGGHLALSTRLVNDDDSGWAVLGVRDTGVGMDDPLQGRIFEPFFTTKEAGTGLGLVNVREIVDRFNGHLRIESAPDQGSLFEAWWPLAGSSAAVPSTPWSEVDVIRGSLALLVSALSASAELVRGLLEEVGFEVGRASTREEALALVDARPPTLVIINQQGPAQPGLDTLRALRARGWQGRVVLCAPAEEAALASSVASLKAALLTNPLDPRALAEAIVRGQTLLEAPAGSPDPG